MMEPTMAMKIQTVSELNEVIRNGDVREYIHQEEKAKGLEVENIAAEVAEQNHRLKWIWLAGPSSAGKTTFTQRLATALGAKGIPTHQISLDNYFVNRELTPKDTKGEHDYEHIEAVDLPLLERHLDNWKTATPSRCLTLSFCEAAASSGAISSAWNRMSSHCSRASTD